MMDYNVETYTLPDSGLSVTVKAADAKAEHDLYRERDNLVEALPKYWTACTLELDGKKPTVKDVLNLRTVDQRFLAIKICRSTIYKPKKQKAEVIIRGACPGCGSPVVFAKDLDTLDFVPCPDGAGLPDPTFEKILPISGKHIVYGQLTGQQQKEELSAEGFDVTEMSWKAIRSVDGDPDVSLEEVMSWPLGDHEELRQDIMDTRWGYDTRVEFKHKCKPDHIESWVLDLFTHSSFIWPGLPG